MITIISIISLLTSLLGISFIISFHELGHFLFLKLFKVYTPTFSLGIGPKIFSKKIGNTDFCISALPFGGYVEYGDLPDHENTKHGYISFAKISYWKKCCVMLGGILFNIIFAYATFSLLFLIGTPKTPILPSRFSTTKIHVVSAQSPYKDQLHPEDTILAINDQKALSAIKLESIYTSLPTGSNIKLTLKDSSDNDKEVVFEKLAQTGSTIEQNLGVVFVKHQPTSFIQGIAWGVWLTNWYISVIFNQIKDALLSQKTHGFAGPIMAIAVSSQTAQKGFTFFLFLLAIISINLALVNLLPLPIFDGGQFVIFTTETILRRKLSDKAVEIINISSWVLMISLFVIFSISDIWTLVQNFRLVG